jgi:hypothetical protein
MANPNPPYIYFAGDSLACVRDTRELALTHGLIWRKLYDSIYELEPGDHLLLVFWKAGEGFVPLARFQTRTSDRTRGEHPVAGWGSCYCVIPTQLQQDFLGAHPGVRGKGYTAADNPEVTAICVEKLEASDDVDAIWVGVAGGPHDLPVAHRYGWSGQTRPALQHFDSGRLVAPILPPQMRP